MDGPDLSGLRPQVALSSGHPPPTADSSSHHPPAKKKSRRGGDPSSQKRRCVSTACIACRRRKSKCDGALPSCAACASVYGTECVYDPNSDHRRKGVYREKIDSMKARNSTLQILIEAILNADEDDVLEVVKRIRTCDSLDAVAESILKQEEFGSVGIDEEDQIETDYTTDMPIEGERDLARKMGELRLENGSTRFIGGTSHLIHWDIHGAPNPEYESRNTVGAADIDPITSWSDVTKDPEVVRHLLDMYFNWHYPYFTTLSRTLFYRDFLRGRSNILPNKVAYCSPLLVNAMLALGCHFTDAACAFGTNGDSWTKGDHFFAEAKRLIVDNDEYEKPRLTTVQALALMSVREAGCGREAKGWVYSGMSFRMAQDLGLNLDIGGIKSDNENLDEQEIDARRVTFWGCFLFDKCWSNYLGRLPQLPKNSYSVPKYDVFPDEDAEPWCPYTDSGFDESVKQPSRTRTIGLQLSKLCEISSDLLLFFYHPNHIGRSSGKSVELKKLSELHRRLEDWRKELPKELEPKEGQLPNVILMHMFFHLQYIHLFRPFLKYSPATSPLPPHVSPRRICTANAGAISKLMRLYKKLYNLRQICNIAVYMLHSACTIHILNLPEKTARRDIIHGVKHLEEIAEDWLCGRRTLSIISVLARKWNVELPEEASHVLQRTDERWGTFKTSDVPSPRSHMTISPSPPAVAMSPPGKVDHSPANHNTPPTSVPSPVAAPASNVPPEIMQNLNSSSSNFQPDSQMPQPMLDSVVIMGNSVPLDTDGLGNPEWRQPPAAQNVLNYPQNFPPVQNGTSSNQAPQNPRRNQVPNSMYAVDGQDWYLKDGVNWQSGFDTWNMGNGSSGSTSISDPSIFIFSSNPPANNAGRSLAPMDFNFEGLNNLSSSMDGWDLPNLE
ncbi:fungal-specific transcription factor domain-containing protein [Daldinia caldariorum]|uniref:fungal-specific transcription factor domain-containing protein n=1 Tax=Daldinia caldariorum TaxID=326644 RepID=UPI0020074137|nr:fungal-specific transcription factor domain-containing protein [Daldinia caldariorum]KAI1465756.1 fungal-specific transcription factor domain-containing protein [Daldinia caldariorum]